MGMRKVVAVLEPVIAVILRAMPAYILAYAALAIAIYTIQTIVSVWEFLRVRVFCPTTETDQDRDLPASLF